MKETCHLPRKGRSTRRTASLKLNGPISIAFLYRTMPTQSQKIASMLTSYKRSVLTICKTASAQESATAASLHVSWTLDKAKKPFADAEFIKQCAIHMAGEILNQEEKIKTKVLEL